MLTRLRGGIGARVVIFLGICLLFGSLVGFWTYRQYSGVAERLAIDSARRTGNFAEAINEQIVRNSFAALQAMSGFQRVQGMKPSDCHDVAAFFLEHSNGYANVGAVTPDGKLYCSAVTPDHPIDHSKSVWFKRAMASGRFSVGDYQISPVTGAGVVMFSLPVKDQHGRISQILFFSLQADYLRRSIQMPDLPLQSSVTVIDQDGHVLVNQPQRGIKVGQDVSSWPIAKRAMSADQGFVVEETGLDGERRVFAVGDIYADEGSVPGNLHGIKSMSFIVGVPARRDIGAILSPVKTAGASVGFFFLTFLIGTYLFLSRTVLTPIRSIQSAAERLSRGDMTVRLPNEERHDEIGALSTAFNAMVDAIVSRDADLRRANDRLRRILDTEPACVLIADNKLNVVDINQAGLDLLRAAHSSDIVGKSFVRFVASEDLERFNQHLGQVTRGKTESIVLQIVNLDGERRWIESHAAEIDLGEGSGRSGIAIIRDKTDELATAAQLVQAQKMESIGRLTGGVAHDFNNLLTVILGNAEALADHLEDKSDLQRLARMIESAAQRGAELIHHMLAFSRRQVLRPTDLNVNTLIAQMADLIDRTLGEDIRIRIETAPDLWLTAADPAQMESAILNLSLNARDAMPDGGTLTIETENTHLDEDYAALNPGAESGDYVLIAVSDSGTGIAPDILEKVFDPFFTTKAPGKGSGLGLSMVYGFVKQSQGHIKIYSEIGQGTTIRIYLPRSLSEGARAFEDATPTDNAGRGETILVVEDEAGVRSFVCDQLRRLGYKVIEARDADGALAVFDSGQHIDLLFTDVVLPGRLNGRQLADIAATKQPGLNVLYTTGYTENAVVHNGKLDAGVRLLTKPYRRGDLARQVRQALDASNKN